MTDKLYVDTPLIESREFAWDEQVSILFKLDALQPTGSFKLRGISAYVQQAVREGATQIVCPSGGNAGFAVAYVGKRIGVPATVIVPETTTEEARAKISSAGANVVVHGKDFDAADAFARQLAEETGAVYVHPFDNPMLWTGHASLVDEVVAAGESFDCIVVSVGGGGLLLGILEGLERNGLAHIPVVAVETEGAASLYRSLQEGKLVTLPSIDSIATSLGARTVAEAALEAATTRPVIAVTVSDAEALRGCIRFANAHRILVEPACGAAIAAVESCPTLFSRFKRPLVVVCGGVGVSLDRLEAWSLQVLAN